MFEIEKSVKEWMRKLKTIESFEDGTIQEIESHLRDEIDRQRANGLTPEDAFARAGVLLFMILTGPLTGSYPATYLAMKSWLGNFAYAAPLKLWLFPAAAVLAAAIALFTVNFLAVKAARTDPRECLRKE